MTPAAAFKRDDLTTQVEEMCKGRFAAAEAERLIEFLHAVTGGVGADDLEHQTPELLYGAVVNFWKFCQERKPGTQKVRVMNPHIEEHGYKSTHTVIEIVNDDMPFIVDSITAALGQFNGMIHLLVHPVLKALRDESGQWMGLCDPDHPDMIRESIVRIEFSTITDPATLQQIEETLYSVLTDVRLAVEDWQSMLKRAGDIVADLTSSPPPLDDAEVSEGRALLEWMIDNHFTFLGYREYDYLASQESESLEIVEGSGLGILRQSDRRVMARQSGRPTLSPEVREFLQKPELVIVTKTNQRSTVHRPVHLDYLGIKRFNEAGEVIGEQRFVGLFTSAAYNRNPRDIPYLRGKVARVMELAGFDKRGHAGKALTNILDTYPRDELFQIPDDELYSASTGILGLQERPRIRLFMRRDRFARFYSCLIYVPRERYDSELRRRFEQVLSNELGGSVSSFYTQIGDEALARLHVLLATDTSSAETVDTTALERKLISVARRWDDALDEALEDRFGEEHGASLLQTYAHAFGVSYREAFGAQMALVDIERLEAMDREDGFALNLYRQIEDDDTTLRLKLYRSGSALALSDVLPMLEHMGLRVLSEQSFAIGDPTSPFCWIHDFHMAIVGDTCPDLAPVKPHFESALLSVWRGDMEDDGFNNLILKIGLTPRQVVMLRAYCKFLRQAGIAFSQDYMEQTLASNGDISALLVELFESLFDPESADETEVMADTIAASINLLLNEVESLDEDRILRRFLNAIQSTLRTNYYQSGTDGSDPKPWLSLKFDSQKLEELPLPRPLREIFVYSPRVEGVHLRGGMVARGGLRWSDRREDFRTEVLGLVKAQMVKNAVIVPVGSKGGFVPKRMPVDADRETQMAEGIACYRMFISGLLDLTDNIIDGDVVRPDGVVCRDPEDPYLVVAADKGTATFSDYANGVAIDYGFWLGDAFASGGAAGYDHKGMGITAKGGWESVKRHFREMGQDIQAEPFTAAGVGDMSGDVFGNGMLLSDKTRLVAAFDHRHIFIDPDPDPATSHQERLRMFNLGRSSWEDYDQSVLSPGAMIASRAAKQVHLTPEAQELLGLSASSLPPQDILQAILTMETDLLWFGGIGTYIKATSESDADAGDRANDAIRINGNEVRAKVIGEGANLGVTQLGRIEFALNNGRINTDFLDNSAGVDCSDHEVNIKILLGAVEAAGDMTRKQRDTQLADMTDEVSELVLRNNYLQSQAITVMENVSQQNRENHGRLMRSFAREGLLNRRIEFLPNDEALSERLALTRPELCTVFSYAKMALKTELLESALPDDPYVEDDLIRYFPRAMRKQYPDGIRDHRLRREIISTQIANFLVNRAGPMYSRLAQEDLGVHAEDVARAVIAARDVFDLRPVWNAIERLDNQVSADTQTRMLLLVEELLQQAGRWFLLNLPRPLDMAATVDRLRPAIDGLRPSLGEMLGELDHAAWRQTVDDLTGAGVPADLAETVAALGPLSASLDIVDAAETAGRPAAAVAQLYFAIGERMKLDWLRSQADTITVDSPWDRQAVALLVDDTYLQQRALLGIMLQSGDADDSLSDLIAAYEKTMADRLGPVDQSLSEISSGGTLDIARLILANRQVGRLLL